MTLALKVAIELSDLFEQTGAEGGRVAQMIDAEIMPHLNEASGMDLGKRLADVIERVRQTVGDSGSDMVRNLKEMMKEVLQTYVKRTSDALTARDIFHHAIMAGAEEMMACVAGVTIANLMHQHCPQEAQHLVKQIAGRLTGEQVAENSSGAAVGAGAIASVPMGLKKKRRKDSIFAEDVTPLPTAAGQPVQNPADNWDMSNVSHMPEKPLPPKYEFLVQLYVPGYAEEQPFQSDMEDVIAIAREFQIYQPNATGSMWHKPSANPVADVATMRVFHPDGSKLSPIEFARITNRIQQRLADHLNWDDLAGNATIIEALKEVAERGYERNIDGVMVDSTTAELVVAAHQAMRPKMRESYRSRSLSEMIDIANRAVKRGWLSVSLEEA